MKIQIVKNDNGYQVRRKRFIVWSYWSKYYGNFCMGLDDFCLTKQEAIKIVEQVVAEEIKRRPGKPQIVQEIRDEDIDLIQAKAFTVEP